MQICASNLHVAIDEKIILSNLNFSLNNGELIGLIGRNGAGKSTLLKALAGLIPIKSGTLTIAGKPLDALSQQHRAQQIAYLPQNGPAHWNLTIEALVELGRLPHRGAVDGTQSCNAKAVARALQKTGLEELRDRSVDTLSGGERMRALLARALAVEAPILLADEPIAALDPLHQLQTLELLRNTAHSGGITIAVLHDLTLASRFCDRLILLDKGTIVANGPATAVLSDTNIANAYEISVHRSTHEGTTFIMPWKPL